MGGKSDKVRYLHTPPKWYSIIVPNQNIPSVASVLGHQPGIFTFQIAGKMCSSSIAGLNKLETRAGVEGAMGDRPPPQVGERSQNNPECK